MFTGLVREIGTLTAVARRGGISVLTLDAPLTAPGLEIGDSLAVNGICLTVVARRAAAVTVEAVAETRRVTTLGDWRAGRRLHLEPALRAGDALGGHLVQGHVDGVGRVASVLREGGGRTLAIAPPPELSRWLAPKGAIAVDGVSLTLGPGPFASTFDVHLIPHTLAATLFGAARRGDRVNLEADALMKRAGGIPERSGSATPLTVERILARGFARGRTRPPRD